ncbi:MAG TPA: periplasmic heavy metal sensor [Stellaceae bacterium]
MTSLAESGQRAGWRGRLLWVALALSLTLNVCFFAGLAWMRVHAPPSPLVRMQHFGDSLKLNSSQRQSYEQFLRTLRLRGRFVRESNQPLIEDVWSELAKPTPDDAAIAKLADQIESNRTGFEREASTALDTFVKTLSPDQRAQLAAKAKAPQDEAARRLFQMVVP